MPTLLCPNCTYTNVLSGKYCGMCGTMLIVSCIVCGEDNLTEAKFCRNCAAEQRQAVPGLLLDRSRAWNDQFWRLGWLNWSDLSDEEKKLYRSQLTSVDKYEAWVFGCLVDGKEMKPKLVRVNNKIVATSGVLGQRGFMVATRCRIGVFSTKSNAAHVFWYKDIKGWSYKENVVTINISNGDTLQWELNPPSAAFADIAIALAATDPVARTWARRDLNVRANERKGFGDLMIDFLNDIFITK